MSKTEVEKTPKIRNIFILHFFLKSITFLKKDDLKKFPVKVRFFFDRVAKEQSRSLKKTLTAYKIIFITFKNNSQSIV